MAAVDFTGTWVEVKKEGFDEVLEAMNIPEEKRKLFAEFKIKQEIRCEGDTIYVKAFMPGMEQELEMKTDNSEKEYDDLLTGQRTKTKCHWEGSTLVADMVTAEGKEGHMERYMDGQQMVNKATVDGKMTTLIMEKL